MSRTKAKCRECGSELAETTSGYYVCLNGHGKLMSKRAVEMLKAEQVEADLHALLNSDEHKAAVDAARKKEEDRKQKRIEVAKKRDENRKRLAALPAAFATKIRGLYKVEDHDGLFIASTKRAKKSFEVLDIAGRRSMWVRQATDGMVDKELSDRGGSGFDSWLMEYTHCLPTDMKFRDLFSAAMRESDKIMGSALWTPSATFSTDPTSYSSCRTVAYENPPGW